jgi:Protein of unknown function (DUF2809)
MAIARMPRTIVALTAGGVGVTLGPVKARWVAAVAAPLIVALGLGARAVLTGLAAKIAGDALYTVLLYDLVIVVRPAVRPVRAGLVALAISFAVEIAQLTPYPAWLSSRHVLLRLIFGTTFGFVDLGGYVVGAVLVVAADTLVRRVASGRQPR